MVEPNPELENVSQETPFSGAQSLRETVNHVRRPQEVFPRPFGRYELRSLLGRGGMGAVYQAYDPQLDRLVALKIPRALSDDIDDWRERFTAEARAAALIHHPNICPVFEVGQVGDQPYLTMPFIEGETLAHRVKRAGKLPIDEAVSLVSLVAHAMGDAHQRGIVHRDLKPANIMIDRRGQPVIMDFGLAYRTAGAADLRLTLSGVALGTPEYMPPEQAGGEHDAIGPSSDVYALGIILNELVTGRVPFQAKSFGKLVAQIERDLPPPPSKLNPEVNSALESIILKSLEKAPSDRFPSATAMANALDAMQKGESIGAWVKPRHTGISNETATSGASRWRSRWPIVAGSVAGLLVVVFLAYSIINGLDRGQRSISRQNPPPDAGVPSTNPGTIQGATPEVQRKPVMVPTKAVNVEIPGWSILTDASKDEMQKWLDDQRQLKHSVTWLDVIGIDGKPIYTAVAAHNAQAADWLAYLDVSQAEINDHKLLAKRGFNRKHVLHSMGGHIENERLVCATLFHIDSRPIDRLGTMGVVGEVALAGQLPALLESGNFLKFARPVSLQENLRQVAAYFEQSPYTGQLYGLGVSEIEFADTMKQMRMKGFRPYSVAPIQVGGQLLYTYTSCDEPLQEVWEHHLDWTAAEFQSHANDLAKKGYRPESVVAYAWNGAVRYSTVWLKEHKSTEKRTDGAISVRLQSPPIEEPVKAVVIKNANWSILTDASLEEAQAWIAEQRKVDSSVIWVDALPLKTKPVFSGIASTKGPKTGWIFLHDLTVEEINKPDLMSPRFEPDTSFNIQSLAGYSQNGLTKCAGLFHAGESKGLIGMMPAPSLEMALRNQLRTGYVTNIVRPMVVDNGVFSVAVYFAPATGTTGAVSLNQSQTKFQSDLDVQRQNGLRPNTITPFEINGELRFAYAFSDIRSEIPWEHHLDWTAADFQTKADELAAKGFLPQSIIAYPWNGAVRYSTIWLKEKPSEAPPAAP